MTWTYREGSLDSLATSLDIAAMCAALLADPTAPTLQSQPTYHRLRVAGIPIAVLVTATLTVVDEAISEQM